LRFLSHFCCFFFFPIALSQFLTATSIEFVGNRDYWLLLRFLSHFSFFLLPQKTNQKLELSLLENKRFLAFYTIFGRAKTITAQNLGENIPTKTLGKGIILLKALRKWRQRSCFHIYLVEKRSVSNIALF
jgi:hypothetical protein